MFSACKIKAEYPDGEWKIPKPSQDFPYQAAGFPVSLSAKLQQKGVRSKKIVLKKAFFISSVNQQVDTWFC